MHEPFLSSDLTALNIIALIPVRRGSAGVSNKNMRLIAGVPLLAYTIAAARNSELISRIIVSADDENTASFVRSEGVEAVLHPPELSQDNAPAIGVILWNYRRLIAAQSRIDMFVVLRATTPLRTSTDIKSAVSLLFRNPQADSVVSVVAVPGIHPVRMKRILDNGMLVDAFEGEGYSPRPRQTLEQLYIRNGGIYIGRPEVLDQEHLWGDHCLGYVMPQERSLNINTPFDFAVAELLIKNRGEPSDMSSRTVMPEKL